MRAPPWDRLRAEEVSTPEARLQYLPETELIDRDFFGAIGWSNYQYGSLTKKASPHLVRAGTIVYQKWNREYMGDVLCQPHHARVFSLNEWDKVYGFEHGDGPFRYCPKCWRKLHAELGIPVPEQTPKYDPLGENYIRLPVRELVNRTTGTRWTPYVILQAKKNGWSRPTGYSKGALKADGTPTYYHRGQVAIIGEDGWAYYDEGRENEAAELRTEIAMHRRKLKEAEKLLAALYKEGDDNA